VERYDTRRNEVNAADGAALAPGGLRGVREVTDEGDPISLGNEFAEVTVRKVRTQNGARLEICSTRLGFAIRLCPLQLEALTWQSSEAFSGFLTNPFRPGADPTPS
jgi:hypothetical protein